MAQPKAATTTSKGRTYGLELPPPQGQVNLWSVTTIIGGGLPKPQLVGWGIWTVARYAVANQERLARMAAAAEGDADALDGVVKWLGGSPYRDKEKKADIGTLLHEIAEADALRKPTPEIPPELTRRYANYLRFIEDWQPEWELSEATVYNVRESCAGTLDGIGRFRGKRVPPQYRDKLLMGDFKSGGEIDLADARKSKGVYPEAALQMAAYRHAEGVYLAPGIVAPMPQVEGAVAIHITDEGYRVLPVESGEGVWQAFRYVREVFRFMEELSKSVIGEPIDLLPAAAPKPRTRKVA